MKRLIYVLMFSALSTQASELKVEVKDFSFSYKNPFGEGKAASFTRTGELPVLEGVKVEVEKLDQDFNFKVTGSEEAEFNFKNAPSLMTDAETMSVQGFNLSLQDSTALSLREASFTSPKEELGLKNVSLECLRDPSLEDVFDQLIQGCFQKMNLRSSNYTSRGENEGIGAKLAEGVLESIQGGFGFSNLSLKVNAGKYDLVADVKADVSGKVKSNGHVSYDPREKKISLKISEVKISILNVTSKVFDELKKKETEKFKVSKPYVYILLK